MGNKNMGTQSAQRKSGFAAFAFLVGALWFAPGVGAQPGGRGGAPQGPPPTARAAAPIDIRGYWVSLVTDDWRWRMMTPPKGDYRRDVGVGPDVRV